MPYTLTTLDPNPPSNSWNIDREIQWRNLPNIGHDIHLLESIFDVADAFESTGLRAAGYKYINSTWSIPCVIMRMLLLMLQKMWS